MCSVIVSFSSRSIAFFYKRQRAILLCAREFEKRPRAFARSICVFLRSRWLRSVCLHSPAGFKRTENAMLTVVIMMHAHAHVVRTQQVPHRSRYCRGDFSRHRKLIRSDQFSTSRRSKSSVVSENNRRQWINDSLGGDIIAPVRCCE